MSVQKFTDIISYKKSERLVSDTPYWDSYITKVDEYGEMVMKFSDSVFGGLQSIENIALDYQKVDCTKGMITLMDDLGVNDFLAGGMKGIIKSGFKALDKIKTDAPGGAIASAYGFMDTVCDGTTLMIENIIMFLDTGSKLVFPIYRQLNKLIQKINSVMETYSRVIQGCVIKTIRLIGDTIRRIISMVKVPGSDIVAALRECPCLALMLAKMFCCKDASGEYETDAQKVFDCIFAKWNAQADRYIGIVMAFIQRYIIGPIQKTFAIILTIGKMITQALILPFRALMQKYCEMLLYKIDVTALVKSAGDMRCILVYTDEKRPDGSTYKGMNYLDMIDTLRVVQSCLNVLCSSFTEDVKLQIAKSIKDLRLNSRYWNDVYTTDIYQSAIGLDFDADQPSSLAVRRIFTKNKTKRKKALSDIGNTISELWDSTMEDIPKVKYTNQEWSLGRCGDATSAEVRAVAGTPPNNGTVSDSLETPAGPLGLPPDISSAMTRMSRCIATSKGLGDLRQGIASSLANLLAGYSKDPALADALAALSTSDSTKSSGFVSPGSLDNTGNLDMASDAATAANVPTFKFGMDDTALIASISASNAPIGSASMDYSTKFDAWFQGALA